MGERISPVGAGVHKKKARNEDVYVAEVARCYKGFGFTEKELRQGYQSGAEEVKSVRSEHLYSLQRLLTPLVIHYTEIARKTLDTKPEQVVFPELTRSPNIDVLVNEIEVLEGYHSEQDINEAVRRIKFDTRGIKNFNGFYDVVRHITENAADLTDENIVIGESKSMRKLSVLMQEFFSNADEDKPTREQSRATFLRSLGLARRPEVIWGETYSDKTADHEAGFNPIVPLPIGEYGEAFTLRFFRTLQQMQDYTLLVKNEARRIAEKNQETFAKTARGRNDSRLGAWLALQEGNISLMQTMYLLTAEKIEGYDDPGLLVADIIQADLPNQLAQIAPAGTIGPITLIGKNIHELIQKTKTGELVLNPGIKKKMLERKRQEVARRILDYNFIRQEFQNDLPAFGQGCPLSHKSKTSSTTGIQELSSLFLEVFKRIK